MDGCKMHGVEQLNDNDECQSHTDDDFVNLHVKQRVPMQEFAILGSGFLPPIYSGVIPQILFFWAWYTRVSDSNKCRGDLFLNGAAEMGHL
jgi:hypothetical protein